MANLFWKTKTATKSLLEIPFKTEEEFKKTVFSTKELLEDILSRKGYANAQNHNKIMKIVAKLECIPSDHQPSNVRINFKQMIGCTCYLRQRGTRYRGDSRPCPGSLLQDIKRGGQKIKRTSLTLAMVLGLLILLRGLSFAMSPEDEALIRKVDGRRYTSIQPSKVFEGTTTTVLDVKDNVLVKGIIANGVYLMQDGYHGPYSSFKIQGRETKL